MIRPTASASLEQLRAHIDELGGGDAHPVVPLELFFADNEDEASIGPNLVPHPGVETFARVLTELRTLPEVADVVLQVGEVLDGEGEWPFVEAAYVITTATPERIHAWTSSLEPDAPADEAGGWLHDAPPPGAPPVPDGHRVVTLYWD